MRAAEAIDYYPRDPSHGPLRVQRRALIVDDDRSFAESMGNVLRTLHWEIDIALNGGAAMERVDNERYDVVLLDLRLKEEDGMLVLRQLRDLPDPPPVIVLSGFLDVTSTMEALHAGAHDLLEKPVDIRHLAAVMERHYPGSSQAIVYDSDASTDPLADLLGASPAMQQVREHISTVARYRDLSVMVIGETGTGKELVAQAIHRLSAGDGAFVAINCAAVPDELFESEVFGHESGAFTGAQKARAGLFEAAGRGAVFLDEIGEMPHHLQAKLLRVLETKTFRRLGSNRPLELGARIVSATNRELRGRPGEPLRGDLFFRLSGYTIRTPSLRERMQDLELLARHFLRTFALEHGTVPLDVSPRALEALRGHDWPGNVRELRSVIQFSAVHAGGGGIGVKEVVQALRARGYFEGGTRTPATTAPSSPPPPSTPSLGDMERRLILEAYRKSNGNLSLAARRLRVPRTTLADKLKRYGIR